MVLKPPAEIVSYFIPIREEFFYGWKESPKVIFLWKQFKIMLLPLPLPHILEKFW